MKFSFRRTCKICIGVSAFFKSSRHCKEGTCCCRCVGGGSLLLEYVLVTHICGNRGMGETLPTWCLNVLQSTFFCVCLSCIARSIVFLVVAGTDTRHAALLLCVLPLISSSVHVSVLSFLPIHPSSFPSHVRSSPQCQHTWLPLNSW